MVLVAITVAGGVVASDLSGAPPAAEFDVRPELLSLDLAAAVALCAGVLWSLWRGRPLGPALALGVAGACLLADALVGRQSQATVTQTLGLAAAPLLVPLLAHAAQLPRRRVLWAAGTAAAIASCLFEDSFLDLDCRRTCVENPLVIAHAAGVVDAARAIELIVTVTLCVAALRRPAVALVGVAISAARLGIRVEDPLQPGQRLLHAAAALGALLVAAAVANDLARLPRTRGRLDRLISRLRPANADGLEQDLRAATGVADLRLAYRHPDRPVHVDAAGTRIPEADLAVAERVEVRRSGELLAALLHAPPDVPAALGPAAALALDNERLAAARRYDLAMLQQTSTHLVAIGDAERRRIERNLHDGAQQRLVAAILAVKLAQLRDPSAALDEALAGLERIVVEVRAVAHGIHPQVLAGEGLGPALRTLAAETGSVVDLCLGDLGRLPEAVEVTVYAAARELIGHGHRTRLKASLCDGWLAASIEAEGWAGPTDFEQLADRARALGGALTTTGAIRLELRLPVAMS